MRRRFKGQTCGCAVKKDGATALRLPDELCDACVRFNPSLRHRNKTELCNQVEPNIKIQLGQIACHQLGIFRWRKL